MRGFSFQKVPNCDWHGPRSHINRVGPIKTTDQVPAEIVQIGIEDGGNLRPLFVVAKNLAVANYSDNLAGLRIDNIALEHVFLFCVSDVTFTTPNSARCSVPVLLSADAARWRAHAVRCPLSDALDCLRPHCSSPPTAIMTHAAKRRLCDKPAFDSGEARYVKPLINYFKTTPLAQIGQAPLPRSSTFIPRAMPASRNRRSVKGRMNAAWDCSRSTSSAPRPRT